MIYSICVCVCMCQRLLNTRTHSNDINAATYYVCNCINVLRVLESLIKATTSKHHTAKDRPTKYEQIYIKSHLLPHGFTTVQTHHTTV